MLADRILLYVTDGDRRWRAFMQAGLEPLTQNSSAAPRLEDVFLHLTGRQLVE